jgi:NAD(P)H-hydrate epimerase
MGKMDAAAIGPGLSSNKDIADVVKGVVRESKIPLDLDADALNALAGDVSILKERRCEIVITPHPGEMSRLLGTQISDIQSNRVAVAKQTASDWNTVVVLKGARTVVASPEGDIWINRSGNNGMSTAGAGDILTGTIIGLIGQGLSVMDAAICGVHLHGVAGDIAAREIAPIGYLATDIQDRLPAARNSVLNVLLKDCPIEF